MRSRVASRAQVDLAVGEQACIPACVDPAAADGDVAVGAVGVVASAVASPDGKFFTLLEKMDAADAKSDGFLKSEMLDHLIH
ncbi:hypothetical protein IMCC9480_2975 [Oxalobacteraceae bacterium IMCC9480]|nr:hypothetical protein IMCC9480_2975 [Oxalobacteraceae bacterium IMCC9480]